MIPYSKTSSSITVFLSTTNLPKTIPSSHPNFAEIVRLAPLSTTTEADLIPLLDIPKAIETQSNGNILVQNGKLFFKGFEIKSSIATYILGLMKEGNAEGTEPYKLFLEKAMANPDPRAATDLFDWVVNSKLPITTDGDVLAWKAVGDDYLSLYAKRRGNYTFDHHIGNIVEEDRTYCDPNPDQTCSRGLHFCSAEYLKHYAGGGNRIVVVKINPADVVAFPRDYDWQKGRAARYQVVGEVPYDRVPDFYPQGRMTTNQFAGVKATPKQPNAVGQVWLDRSGNEQTIKSIGGIGGYPVYTKAGHRYTATGRYISDTNESLLDLVKFVR